MSRTHSRNKDTPANNQKYHQRKQDAGTGHTHARGKVRLHTCMREREGREREPGRQEACTRRVERKAERKHAGANVCACVCERAEASPTVVDVLDACARIEWMYST